jgi:CHAT domain-containing protein/tetratricopeptide (TPR) repeat protein
MVSFVKESFVPFFEFANPMIIRRTLLILLLLPSWSGAQTTRTAKEGILRADEFYDADKLFEAEPLYQQALQTDAAEQKRRAFDRLMAIYTRISRPDQVVRYGVRYQEWLSEMRDWERFHEVSVDIAGAYLALGHLNKAKELLDHADPKLSPIKKLTALSLLAIHAERTNDSKTAQQRWLQLQEAASSELASPRVQANPRFSIDGIWRLAESFRNQNRAEKGIEPLRSIISLHEKLLDYPGKRETLRTLAEHYRLSKQPKEAIQSLENAIELHDQRFPTDRVTAGNMQLDLSEIYRQKGDQEKAEATRTKAIQEFRSILSNPHAGKLEVGAALTAFWKLQGLYVELTQYRRALQLTATKAEDWEQLNLIQPRIKFEQGSLELMMGLYSQARDRLRASVVELEKSTPISLIEYPRACNHLSLVELATGDPKRGELAANKTVAIYKTYRLPDDTVLVDTQNLLGTCLAQQGEYPKAIDRYREGIGMCEKIGSSAMERKAGLYLNIALLLKTQGDLDEAMKYCQKAIETFHSVPNPDPFSIAALQAALANMHTTRGELKEADTLAQKILDACQKLEIDRGPLIITARHCQALYHLKQREFSAAEARWEELRKTQEKEQSILLPRTLNYLALSAELQQRLPEAAKLYEQADALQIKNPRAFPVTHFITLWGWANVLEKLGKSAEARKKLDEAISIAEKARSTVYGDSQQRANFFSQFAPGFEKLVESCLRDRDTTAAFLAAGRSRGRNLFDHLQMAQVDPREGLTGAQAQEWLREEASLLKTIAGLRIQAQLIPPDGAQTEAAKKLLAEYDTARNRYAEIYREILNASPIYRSLSEQQLTLESVKQLQEQILSKDKVLLVYHIGSSSSHVFLLSRGDSNPEVFELKVSKDLANKITLPDPSTGTEVLRNSRGIVLRNKNVEPVPEPEKAPDPGPVTSLTQSVARSLIDHYRLEVVDNNFTPSRGIVLRSKDKSQPIATQRLDLLGEIFLPSELRKRLAELGPKTLIVVPDGPLHKLPLEAMLLRSGSKPRYVVDELPPIVYSPSTSILIRLAQRPRPSTNDFSLLTISNPAYPQQPTDSKNDQLFTKLGSLPLLQGSAKEAEMIQRFFSKDKITHLEGDTATKKRLVAAIPGKSFIHIAAHGFADDRFGNLFGAIALTPPPAREIAPDNDGFLSLHEIYRLPLQNCELAVLSACVTNVGPQQPLEAGVTLASGFLTSGAHRVVASHWSVDDAATAELMNTFFSEITTAAKKGTSIPYAEALQKARQKVRETSRYRSPYYWAPFVLIGPGN